MGFQKVDRAVQSPTQQVQPIPAQDAHADRGIELREIETAATHGIWRDRRAQEEEEEKEKQGYVSRPMY